MTAEELRVALFEAIARGDGEAFTRLASANADAVVESFPSWAKVPEALRTSPASVQAWVQALIEIAKAFQAAGRPEPMALLRGRERGDNPIDRWRAAYFTAEDHSAAGRYREAIDRLEPAVTELASCQGTAVDEYRGKLLGALGVAYFRLGDLLNAERCMLDALEECRRTSDAEGVATYTRNLAHIASRKPSS